ncbi:MAG: hypothetical protein Q7U16_07380 [Agitococcus sp.]|nr:hypothetical protein [Agitococcus sp.]
MKKILLVAYGGGHIAMLIPIIKALRETLLYQVDVLALTTAAFTCRQHNITAFGFRDLLVYGDSEYALTLGYKLSANFDHVVIEKDETAAYLGLNYAELESVYGVKQAAEIYANRGRQAFLPTQLMGRLIADRGYDLVVATNSPRAERAAILAAHQQDVPSVCIVDLFATQESAWIGHPDYASRVCVLSPFVRNRLLMKGRHEAQVVVTGNPAFDRLADSSLPAKAALWRENNAIGDKKVIVWASQDEPAVHPFSGKLGDPLLPRKIDQQLLALLAKHEDWFLVIRHHPSEQVTLTPLPERAIYSTKEENLAVLLASADVVVILSSTVGLEAALLGRPVLALELSVASADAPFASMGIARGLESMDELEAALADILDDGQTTLVDPMALPQVGSATQNVLTVINSLL